jgi:hypothetical protein
MSRDWARQPSHRPKSSVATSLKSDTPRIESASAGPSQSSPPRAPPLLPQPATPPPPTSPSALSLYSYNRFSPVPAYIQSS